MMPCPTFFALAVAVTAVLATPSVKPRADSEASKGGSDNDIATSGPVVSCQEANDRYTASVLTAEPVSLDFIEILSKVISEDNQKQFNQASATTDELYKTIRHVDYDTGSPVVPTLSQQQEMRSKLHDLTAAIEGARPLVRFCWSSCGQFDRAIDTVSDVENALGSLAKSCGDQPAQPANSQPSPSSTTEGATVVEPTGAPKGAGTQLNPIIVDAGPASGSATGSAFSAAMCSAPAAPNAGPTTSPSVQNISPSPSPATADSAPVAVPAGAVPAKSTEAAAATPKATGEVAEIVITSNKPIKVTEISSPDSTKPSATETTPSSNPEVM